MIPTKLGKLPMPGKDVKILGCFNDNVIFRAIGGKMTSYKTEEVVKKCYERAKAIKAKVFAVQFGTACFTNKNADKEYAKYGRALLGGCTNGKGGPSMNDVYEISYGGKGDDIESDNWEATVGFCVDCNGNDQTVGEVAEFAPNKESCLARCRRNSKATGCEYHNSRWCTVHTKPVARGDKKDKKTVCWAVNDCKKNPGKPLVDPAPPKPVEVKPKPLIIAPAPVATKAPLRTIKHIDPVTVAKPKPLIVATAPRVTKAPLRTIKHIDPKAPLKVAYVVKGGYCYNKCGKKYGPCEDYCGKNNFCCKKGNPGCEDALRDLAPKGSRCVAWRVPECVRQDRNFAGNNVGKVTKQASWEKCSQACDKEPACKAFSFVRDNYKVAKNRGNCHFKNKNFGNRIQNLKGVFSAKRGCGTKYTGVNGPGLIQTRPPTILPPTRRPPRPPTRPDYLTTMRPEHPDTTWRPTRHPTPHVDHFTDWIDRPRTTWRPRPRTTWRPNRPHTDFWHAHTDPPHLQPGHDFSYGNYKNKQCRTRHEAMGCYQTRKLYKRGKLLIYWRHEIEWAKNRISSFASSLACACAEAAQKNGYHYYGIHYWGECWGLRKRDIRPDHEEGDCVLADGLYKNKCGNMFRGFKKNCLGNESYATYEVGPMIMI